MSRGLRGRENGIGTAFLTFGARGTMWIGTRTQKSREIHLYSEIDGLAELQVKSGEHYMSQCSPQGICHMWPAMGIVSACNGPVPELKYKYLYRFLYDSWVDL